MATNLARAIALPGKHAPLRFPSFPALERTAVMAFNASMPFSIGADSTKVILTRQAALPLWGETKAPGGENAALTYGVVYSCTGVSAVNTQGGIYTEAVDAIGGWHQSVTYGLSAPVMAVPGGTWPTSYPVVAFDAATGDLPWVYCPNGGKVLITSNAMAFAHNDNIQLERWTGPGQSEPITLTAAHTASLNLGGGSYFDVTANAWYRFRSSSIQDTTTGSVLKFTPVYSLGVLLSDQAPTFTGAAVNGTWAIPTTNDQRRFLLPLTVSPEFSNSHLPWAATRLTAVGALFTNTTKVLNKEGTVLWGRINPVVYDPFIVTSTTIQNLHPAEKAYLDLEHGTYAYNPPSTDLADFTPYILRLLPNSASNSAIWPVYRLDNRAFAAVGFFNDPDGGTNLAVNLDYHIEFRTSSTLFQIGVSTMPLEALHAAQIVLLKAGFFFHNEDHGAVIARIVKFMAGMHPLLSMAVPIANGLIGASSYALSSKPNQSHTPAATSGQGAGMVSVAAPPRPRRAAARRPPARARPRPRRAAPPPPPPPQKKKGKLASGLDMYLSRKKR